MHLPPIEVLQSWPTPDYENPQTRGNGLVVINSVFIGLAFITVGLRLYTRIWIKRWFGIDDIFTILASIFASFHTASVILANQKYGWDRHIWDIPIENFSPALKILYFTQIQFIATATFTRLSLHCLYYRLVSDTGITWFKWLIHANVACTVCIFISATLVQVFQCHPVQAYWLFDTPGASCHDEQLATLIFGVVNCIADLATTVTPLPLILRLQIPRRQRYAAAVIFSFGMIVTIAGVVRTWALKHAVSNNWDVTWSTYPSWIASAVEINLGVICASAPVCRPLLTRISFNSSVTSSRDVMPIRSPGYTSHNSDHPTSTGFAPSTSITSLRRKSEATTGVTELATDGSKSYEMIHWNGVEQAAPGYSISCRNSAEHIVESPEHGVSKWGLRSVWEKATSGEDEEERKGDMTITLTSEVEIHMSRASGETSTPSSRYSSSLAPQTDSWPLPPLP
ncbi:hypothetical protein CC86DRAFT_298489 [Ophiobolus disseminans]|uniref:Rhodopsin domain-containing protein n=1 Tax=Ophiobolus disseminans TaxID=1469910 RepID=A0A6A6ZST0_9PLEO|nr:hypothetical protein CC86DRAFT_298489 [Ophiobolus disseminans]